MTGDGRGRLWMLAWDGAPAWLTRRMLAEGLCPNLERLAAEGAVAAGLRSDAPDCSTPPAFAALLTGHRASDNGITSFRIPHDADGHADVLAWRSGFDPFLLEREPLWIAALRRGRSCTLVHTPLSSPPEAWASDRPFAAPEGTPLVILHGYGRQMAPARCLRLDAPVPLGPWEGLPFPLAGCREHDLGEPGHPLPALDVPPRDGCPRSLWVAESHDRGGAGRRLAAGAREDAFRPFVSGAGLRRHVRLFEAPDDGAPMLVWLSACHELQALPAEAGEAYLAAIGSFPGGGDHRSMGQGAFGPLETDGRAEERYLETHRLAMGHFRAASIHAVERHPADLMIFYHPGIDEVGHQWAGVVDEESPAHDPRAARFAWPVIRGAYGEADRHLGELMARCPADTHLVCLSDHGMGSVHRHFLPNVVLREAGLLASRTDERGEFVLLSETDCVYGPANNGFVTVNRLAWKDGRVPSERVDGVVEAARDALMAHLDPATGKPVLAAAIRVDRLDRTMQFHGRGRGELFLVARRGYSLGDGLGTEALVRPVLSGHHQQSPAMEQHLGIFALRGPTVRPASSLGVVDVLDVHESLRAMLGLATSGGPGRPLTTHLAPDTR